MKILKLYKSNFYLTFLIFYLIISLPGIIFAPLFDEDEGFFAEAARFMLESGDYVSINVNGETRYDKPAFSFWLTTLSLRLFGINEFAARLPSFLSFNILLFCTFNFVKKNFSEISSKYSLLILASILQFQILGRAAVSDNFLNLFITLALFSFYHYTQKQSLKNIIAVFVFAGFGFLTKGPIAYLVIFGVIFLVLIFTRKIRLLYNFLNPIYWLISLVIPSPWFYLAYKKSGSFLIQDFIFKHNLGRFTQTMESHGGSYFYYLPVLFLAFLPFSHLIIKSLKVKARDSTDMFLFIWFFLPFVVFSFSKTQLPHYISIGYVPLAILMSKRSSVEFKWVYFQILLLMLLFFTTPLIINYFKINDFFVEQMLSEAFVVYDSFYYCVMLILIFASILVYKISLKSKFFSFAQILIFGIAVNFFIYKFAILQQRPLKEAAIWIKANKFNVKMTDHYNPSLSFYTQKQIKIVSHKNENIVVFQKQQKNNNNKVLSKFGPYVFFENFRDKD